MNYKVGDTVVCIDAVPLKGNPVQLELGKRYLVEAFIPQMDGKLRVQVATEICGIPWIKGRTTFRPYRFIKLPEVTARTEVTSEAEAI